MKNKTEFKVGLTVFVGAIVFILLIFWAKDLRFGQTNNEFFVKFNSVSGLEIGDQVTVSGVKRGKVEDIKYDNSGAIVHILLSDEVKLPADSRFSVMMLDLMGGKKIEITPGKSNKLIDYSVVQTGVFAGDISTAMAVLSSLQGDIISLVKSVNTSLAAFNKIIGKGELSEQIIAAVKNVNEVSENLNSILNENRAGLKQLITNGNEIAGSANKFITENDKEISAIFSKANKLLDSTSVMINSLNSIANETKAKNNNLGKILYDKNLIDSLQSTFTKTKNLIDLLNKQLNEKGLKVNADVSVF